MAGRRVDIEPESENRSRLDAAMHLHSSLKAGESKHFANMEAAAAMMKRTFPELAEEIDLLMRQAKAEETLVPELMTRHFLARTEEPPVVVEGEVVDEPQPEEGADAREEHDG